MKDVQYCIGHAKYHERDADTLAIAVLDQNAQDTVTTLKKEYGVELSTADLEILAKVTDMIFQAGSDAMREAEDEGERAMNAAWADAVHAELASLLHLGVLRLGEGIPPIPCRRY